MIAVLFFICSNTIFVKHINVLQETTNEEVEENNQKVIEEYNYNVKICSEVLKEKECKERLNYMLDTIYTNDELLNKTLRELPKKTNLLHIIVEGFSGTIDFNSLPSKMLVYIQCSLTAINSIHEDKIKHFQRVNERFSKKMNEVKFDGSHRSFLELSKSLASKDKLPKYEYIEKLRLVGDIGNKVPFITFDIVILEIIDSDLNCENAYFKDVVVKENSKKIKVKNLIVHEVSHRGSDLEKINVTQYMIELRDLEKYYLKYNKYELNVFKYETVNQEIMDQHLDIPYSISKTIGFYTISDEIEISTVVRKSEYAFPNLNLTVTDKIFPEPLSLPYKFTIKTKNWDKFDGIKPTIFLAIDKGIHLDKTGASDIEIKDSTLPVYDYPNNEDSKSKNKNKTAMIIGIVVAVVVVIVIIIIILIVVHKKKADNVSKSEGEEANET